MLKVIGAVVVMVVSGYAFSVGYRAKKNNQGNIKGIGSVVKSDYLKLGVKLGAINAADLKPVAVEDGVLVSE